MATAHPSRPRRPNFTLQDQLTFTVVLLQVRVTVADSRLALERGDQEGALKKLRKVPKGSPHYTRAQTAMADIYLKHRHDRAAYIQASGAVVYRFVLFYFEIHVMCMCAYVAWIRKCVVYLVDCA